MKIQLLAAIAAVTVVGGCTAWDPPLADAIPQTTNACVQSAGGICTADKWMAERDQRAAQYYGETLQPAQPSPATASARPAQPPS
jgi:hypothetical protein